MKVNIKKLHNDAIIPTYATFGSVGFDLCAIEEVMIHPGHTVILKTGLCFEVPQGFEMQVRPRSGITTKTKLRVQLGTIDSDYRGEIGVIVDNIGQDVHRVAKFDRIAQAIIAPINQVVFNVVNELEMTERGTNGFGSTGLTVDKGLLDLIKQVIK